MFLSLSADPGDPKRYKWYIFKGKKVYTLKSASGKVSNIKPGSIYGIRNLTNRIDRVVVLSTPDTVFSLPVETVSDIMDDSKRHKEEVKFPDKGPKRIKIVQDNRPKKEEKIQVSNPVKKEKEPTKVEKVFKTKKVVKKLNAPVKRPVTVKNTKINDDYDLEDYFPEHEDLDSDLSNILKLK